MDVWKSFLFVTIEHYVDRIKSALGMGSFGEVYSAIDYNNHESAIKRISFKSAKEIRRIEREIEIFVKMNGKSDDLVRLLDRFIEDKYYYIVMEHCKGGDFGDLLKRRGKHSFNVC
jgi:serine/threonine protein kinase